jgi:GT2 family glycosyltransferase
MSLTITALVIGGNTEYLEETLFGLMGQSRRPDRIIVGCANSDEEEIASKQELPLVSAEGNFQEKLATLIAAADKTDWYWVIFADSCPDPTALERLALTAETSPSASAIAPKLLDWEHPDTFISFGKTITQVGESFELVDSEIDQGQHDLSRDVLASDFAGLLVHQQALRDFENSSAPMAARSTIFGISQWLAGKRVTLEPKAKVRISKTHGIDGTHNRLGNHFAKRFADYHLSLITLPRFFGFFLWLVIPLTSLIRSLWLVGSRRVRFFIPELASGIFAFVSVGNHLKGSSELRKIGKLQQISQLKADRAKIRDRSRRSFSELPPSEYRPSLLSGPWAWLLPLLVILNYRLFPSSEAVLGGNLIPLNSNWFELVSAGWRSIDGFPTDSVVFPIAVISLVSFWAPFAAIGWFVFIAPALAFAGTWLALSRLTENRLLVTLLSLGYALSPVFSAQLLEPDIGSLISVVLLGWLVHGLQMVLQSSVSSRAWRWTAWSAFLLAMIGASYPALILVLVPVVFLMGIANLRRVGFLAFVPVVVFVVIWPQLIHWILNPLAIFAPMGAEFGYSNDWKFDYLLAIPLAAIFAVAFIAFFIMPKFLSLLLLFAASLSVLAFAALEHIQFVPTPGFSEASSANGFPFLALGLIALLAIIAMNKKRSLIITGGVVSLLVAITGGYTQLTTEVGYQWGEYRQVPAIVEVESQRFELNTLMISNTGDVVYLRLGNGENLGEQSMLANLFGASDIAKDEAIARLSASLIASNSVGIQELMDQLSVAFVQLEGDNPEVASQLSRLPELNEFRSDQNSFCRGYLFLDQF